MPIQPVDETIDWDEHFRLRSPTPLPTMATEELVSAVETPIATSPEEEDDHVDFRDRYLDLCKIIRDETSPKEARAHAADELWTHHKQLVKDSESLILCESLRLVDTGEWWRCLGYESLEEWQKKFERSEIDQVSCVVRVSPLLGG